MSYDSSVPASGQTLGGTRLQIQTNFADIATNFAINHEAFNDTGEGKHKFLQMPVQGSAPAVAASENGVYVKDDTGGVAQLFVRGEGTGSEYQLTHLANGVDAAIATCATNTEYSAGPPSLKGGWTFLAGSSASGSMLMQYGSVTNVAMKGTATTVTFPRAFGSAPYSICVTMEKSGNSPTADNIYVKNGTITASQFQIVSSDSSARIGYWYAIGTSI